MIRTTDIMKNSNLIRNVDRQRSEMTLIQNQLSTGQKISRPGEDPTIATNQMLFRTRLDELNRFESNINDAKSRVDLTDVQLSRATDILQRIRELTVQASNGIYQGDDKFELRNVIAKEIDEHLRALIDLGNSMDGTGKPLFGGFEDGRPPFQAIESTMPELKGIDTENRIVAVNYQGDIGRRLHEVDRSQYIETNFPGNQVFWGTNMTVTSSSDNGGWSARRDQSIRLDGQEIQIAAGDTMDDVIDKINNAGLEVKAEKVGMDFLSLHTTQPHQIWLEDMNGGTVLQELGLVRPDNTEPPGNFADTARVSGMSIFDSVIKLRNDLLAGDQLEISGRDLGILDESMNNLLRHRAEIGAKSNRLEENQKRVAWDKGSMHELLAATEGIDFPEAIMNLKWLETVHQYALNVGSRLIRPTLMDFMR